MSSHMRLFHLGRIGLVAAASAAARRGSNADHTVQAGFRGFKSSSSEVKFVKSLPRGLHGFAATDIVVNMRTKPAGLGVVKPPRDLQAARGFSAIPYVDMAGQQRDGSKRDQAQKAAEDTLDNLYLYRWAQCFASSKTPFVQQQYAALKQANDMLWHNDVYINLYLSLGLQQRAGQKSETMLTRQTQGHGDPACLDDALLQFASLGQSQDQLRA